MNCKTCDTKMGLFEGRDGIGPERNENCNKCRAKLVPGGVKRAIIEAYLEDQKIRGEVLGFRSRTIERRGEVQRTEDAKEYNVKYHFEKKEYDNKFWLQLDNGVVGYESIPVEKLTDWDGERGEGRPWAANMGGMGHDRLEIPATSMQDILKHAKKLELV
jgi:ssDNA-binding Zn-finger/Zn-ribbon topoisomerase 1